VLLCGLKEEIGEDIRGENRLEFVLGRYCAYFNDARPHQGIAQKIPSGPSEPPTGGLHHDYRRVA